MCSGANLSPGVSAYQRIISNNSYAHDEQGYYPGQEKSDRCLIKVVAAPREPK